MGRYLGLLAGAAAVVAAAASPASAAVVFFDNFDAETAALNTTLTNFNVTAGTIDVVASGTYGITCSGNCVDLDGSTGDAGVVTSKTTFGPGNFKLSFDLSGNQRGFGPDIVEVSYGGTLLDTITLASSDPFATHSYNVSGAGQISFSNAGGDNVGVILDNVRLATRDTAAVPEPSTLAIIGGGLAALGLLRRRRILS
jgi:hypothetical protein